MARRTLAYMPRPGTVVVVTELPPRAGLRRELPVGAVVVTAGPLVYRRPSPMRCTATGAIHSKGFRSLSANDKPLAPLDWLLLEEAGSLLGSVCRCRRATPEEEAAWRLSRG